MNKIKGNFFFNLSGILKTGIHFKESLDILMEQSRGKMRDTVVEIRREIVHHKSIAKAFENASPLLFTRFDINLIHAGEISGNLVEAFKSLSEWYFLKVRLISSLISDLLYPGFVLHLAILINPIPELFRPGGTLVSYLTGIVITLLCIYVPGFFLYTLVKLSYKTDGLGQIRDAISLKIPILRTAIIKLSLARFCFSFSNMYKAGIAMDHCILSAAQNCGNYAMEQQLIGGYETVKKGQLSSVGFSKKLPFEFISLWKAGENGGRLEETAQSMADKYFEEAQSALAFTGKIISWTIVVMVFTFIAFSIIAQWQANMDQMTKVLQ